MRNQTIALLLLAASGLGRSFAQTAAPATTYTAITDRTVRTKPALPSMGPAGSIVVDPTFKTRILRVTDANSNPEMKDIGRFTTSGSFTNTWSTDSRHFFILNNWGWTELYAFDPSALKATFVRTIPVEGPWFSFQDPNIVYGKKSRQIVAYNIQTDSSTTLVDLNTIVPNYPGGEYTVSASFDDTRFAIAVGGEQDTYKYLVNWDRASKTARVWNLNTNLSDGKATGIDQRSGWGIHSCLIDRTGRYVYIDGPGFEGGAVWDSEAGKVTRFTANISGHWVMGFGDYVNQSGIENGSLSDSRGYTYRSLATPNSNLTELVEAPPAPYSWLVDGHISWGSVKPNVKTPVVASTVRVPTNSSQAWGLYHDEIIGVRTDGQTKTVWRFAHHRTIYDGNNFWDSPRGNLSQDGRYYIFTSNWEKTLGNNRQDVFLVELPVEGTAAPDSTPPAVQITSPTAGQTVSGTFTVTATASDNAGIAGVQFQVDGRNVGAEVTAAPYTVSIDGATLTAGNRMLTAIARDAAGNKATSNSVQVVVQATSGGGSEEQPAADETAPAVAITSPANGASVTGSVTVSASASDNVGVAGVQFFVNGSPLGAEDMAAPYSVAWNTTGLAAGTYSLTARARDAAGNAGGSAVISVTVPSGSTGGGTTFKPIRINAGGPAYTDASGIAWSADSGFSGGETYKTTSSISGVNTAALYQTERYGNFTYRFTVPNGTYPVRLKFAEIYFAGAGERLFDVQINGKTVLSRLDLYQTAGAFKAFDRDFSVAVTNGEIVIRFVSVVENPKVSAIEILAPQAAQPPAAMQPIRVNAGGSAYTDGDGQVWSADNAYSGGATYQTTAPVAGTAIPKLYQTERYGAHSYRFTAPNGSRTVTLKFAEIYFGSEGERVFHVNINGTRVLSNFDIFREAGGSRIAVDKQFPVNVTDNQIRIELIPVVENPKIAAIEIY